MDGTSDQMTIFLQMSKTRNKKKIKPTNKNEQNYTPLINQSLAFGGGKIQINILEISNCDYYRTLKKKMKLN